MSTSIFAAVGIGVMPATLGTRIVPPATSRRMPGLSAASSLGLAWNFSPSASAADWNGIAFSFAFAIIPEGVGANGPATSASVIV